MFIVTAIGDAFFSDAAGHVFWLDTGSAEVIRLAESREAFNELMKDATASADIYVPELTRQLVATYGPLGKGACFSPVIPYTLGGKLEVANFHIMEISAHFRSSSMIQRQVANLAVGTKIDRVIKE